MSWSPRKRRLLVDFLRKAAPHNSARDISERFCPKIKFEKRRNTLCISSFSNCNIGTKDPLMSADAIVRCCLDINKDTMPSYVASIGFFSAGITIFRQKSTMKKEESSGSPGDDPETGACFKASRR